MKWTDLHKTQHDDDPERDDDEDADLLADEEPKLIYRAISHKGGINRIRSLNGKPIISLWNEDGNVEVHDLSKPFS